MSFINKILRVFKLYKVQYFSNVGKQKQRKNISIDILNIYYAEEALKYIDERIIYIDTKFLFFFKVFVYLKIFIYLFIFFFFFVFLGFLFQSIHLLGIPFIIFYILKWLFFVIPLLLVVAFFTVYERKGLASVQRRRGPVVVGFAGLMQAIADAAKLFFKEYVIPAKATRFVFIFAPVLTMLVAFLTWTIIPFSLNEVIIDLNIGVLYLFAVTGLGIFGIILAGWSSNSKFPLLGAQRSGAQMLSYELVLGLSLLCIFYICKSVNLTYIVYVQSNMYWFLFPMLIPVVIYFVMSVAELNRPPFDLPEAEAELVSGYNVEYSASGFVLFFLAECLHLIYQSTLISLLFLGGWDGLFFFSSSSFWLSIKIVFCISLFVLIRAALPRYRYDILMKIAWKTFMPLILAYVVFLIFFYSYFFTSFYPSQLVYLYIQGF